MIKIRRNKSELDKIALHHFLELKKQPFAIETKIEQAIADNDGKAKITEFYYELNRDLKNLIIGWPDVLKARNAILKVKYDAVLTEFAENRATQDEITAFKNELESVFNYTKFSKGYTKWGAYQLVQALSINVCPYCNRNFTNTYITKEKGKTRAKLDHWLDKGTYPYLALSFFNLIPNCHICNSDLKGSTPFDLTSHIHPYIEGFENEFMFKSKVLKADYIFGETDSFNIDIEPSLPTSALITRAEQNIREFKIKELYNFHKDIAGEVIAKAQVYEGDYINVLLAFKVNEGTPEERSIFQSKNEVIQMVLNCYTEIEDFEKRPMSKFIRDIAKEQGLLEYL